MKELRTRVETDLLVAMKARDPGRANALRAIKSAILLELTREGGASLDERECIRLLQRLTKQRSEAAAIYTEQGREDLAAEERAQAAVIAEYMPSLMSEEELRQGLSALIEELGAASMRDMGKIMAAAGQRFGDRAEGATMAALVKGMLSN